MFTAIGLGLVVGVLLTLTGAVLGLRECIVRHRAALLIAGAAIVLLAARLAGPQLQLGFALVSGAVALGMIAQSPT